MVYYIYFLPFPKFIVITHYLSLWPMSYGVPTFSLKNTIAIFGFDHYSKEEKKKKSTQEKIAYLKIP